MVGFHRRWGVDPIQCLYESDSDTPAGDAVRDRAAAHADSYAYTDPYGYTHTDIHSFPHFHQYTFSNRDTHPKSDGNCCHAPAKLSGQQDCD